MKTPIPSVLSLLLLLLLSVSADEAFSTLQSRENFVQCLTTLSRDYPSITKVTHTPTISSYASVLDYSTKNLRFSSPTTPKPQAIITPLHESHIQAAIICSKKHGLQVRFRSGGHDYEGLSYVSQVPFVVIDMRNFRSVAVDEPNGTAWAQAGATLGEVYYGIAATSRTLGFPAGTCPAVGVGGHLSGGGYGTMLRRHGLAADNVIDAIIVDVNGKVLNRQTIGEDLFWGIRGGGGASFGVIIAWKIKLVSVPPTVTVFTLRKTLEQNATKLVHRWQSIAPKLDPNLYIRVTMTQLGKSNEDRRRQTTVQASFIALFLGRADELLRVTQRSFPELGLTKEDCTETSWIRSIIYFAELPPGNYSPDVLLNRAVLPSRYMKAKSDYVKEPIPEMGLEGIWKMFLEDEAKESEMIFTPYGGRMSEIPAYAIPYPHRAGNLYNIQQLACWKEGGTAIADRHIAWIRRLYSYMAPFVTKSPRSAYMNYRDFDVGVNNIDNTSYRQASVWGFKYFDNNFNRLVRVKTNAYPGNFLKNEQSIPSLSAERS
ncbi:berberine bridge enzyme-like 18 [Malania oleifera]|uniref:berberine bridge enzyme-like 18 n=1 Tax=Malania oleifera TaxID=397392 RepID=UPI0025ADBAB3|nr:berberine bridge enzyme-like 18 [Malania oleifera]